MSKPLIVALHCCFCSEKHEQTIPMPDGWDSRYRSVSDDHAFCPRHSAIAAFADSQCPGCVGGWGDCPLFDAFAYRELKLTPDDFEVMQTGICPKRVNGTMMFARGKMTDIDIRDPAIASAGMALAKAIGEYVERFHKDKP